MKPQARASASTASFCSATRRAADGSMAGSRAAMRIHQAGHDDMEPIEPIFVAKG
jgi:hypothetical protein